MEGGGAYSGTLNNCTLTGNSSAHGGGAAYSTLNNCTLTGNRSGLGRWAGYGGGAAYATLNNCTLRDNSAIPEGGGAYYSALNKCMLIGNSASRYGGGAHQGTLIACVLTGNRISGNEYWSGGGGASFATLINCTLTANSARFSGGGVLGSTLTNCIVYYNMAETGANYVNSVLEYSCTSPLPATGFGNISAEPQLVSSSHLSSTSPCRGAGGPTSANAADIDGQLWADQPSIGCDEFHQGDDTGPLTIAVEASYTKVATGFEVPLPAQIIGHASANRWEFGDGTVLTNRPASTHSWQSPGRYPAVVWAYNQSNPGGISATVIVHVVERQLHVAADNTNPVAPYSSWATAAKTIQDAIDAASPGGLVLVTNGIYQTGGRVVEPGRSNRVAVTIPLTLRSVNGPEATVIHGDQAPGATNGDGWVRCAYLTTGAALVGFTLTNGGAFDGGGVWCESANVAVSNCVLVGNTAGSGGGAFWGTLDQCRLSSNIAAAWGGGAVRSILNRCVLTNNSAGQGGAAYNATLNQCTISENVAGKGAGVSRCRLDRCIVSGNRATPGDGGNMEGGLGDRLGIGGGALSSFLSDCLVFDNTALYGGGAFASSFKNSAIVKNTAEAEGGGLWAWSASGGCTGPGSSTVEGGLARCHVGASEVVNCIISDNTAPTGANHLGFIHPPAEPGEPISPSTMNYSCTIPLPPSGIGNITNAPLFVDKASGNFRLQTNSPCINAGRNADASFELDLDGNSRIVRGTVDMGPYEIQSPQSALPYAWLQQYSLPADGSADQTDPDGDGQNNWQESRAWTDPISASSVFRLLTPTTSTNGVLVRWQSVRGQTYSLQRGTDLSPGSAFATLATNITGQEAMTEYADTNAVRAGPFFYRVGVND